MEFPEVFLEELDALRDCPAADLPAVDDDLLENKNAVVWLGAVKLLTVALVLMLLVLEVLVALRYCDRSVGVPVASQAGPDRPIAVRADESASRCW